METRVYSILDCLAHEWANPFVAKNDEVAARLFTRSFPQGIDPAEYELYYVGDFDTETGTLSGTVAPKKVFVAPFTPKPIPDISKQEAFMKQMREVAKVKKPKQNLLHKIFKVYPVQGE